MIKQKRQNLHNALMDLKSEFFINERNMTAKQKEIIRRNIKSIEKVIDNLFFTI